MADSKKPTPPDAGPGLRADLKEKADSAYGRVEVDERFADLDDPLAEIPDDAEADLDTVIRDAKVQEVLDRLDRELVALHEVKRRVAEIAALLMIDKVRRHMGLEADPPTLHMSFTGNPARGRPPWPSAWARSCANSATYERATWSPSPATTWWASTWATPPPRPRRS